MEKYIDYSVGQPWKNNIRDRKRMEELSEPERERERAGESISICSAP